MILDGDDLGPAGGMLKAFEAYPEVDWLVVACDLPHLSSRTFEELLNHYEPENPVTAFISKEGNFPEALCALYTPYAREIFKTALNQGVKCPVKMVKAAGANLIQPTFDVGLTNINTPEEKAHEGH
jgi:molybdopterin-guanine dinucleotide biosynthesis protein A